MRILLGPQYLETAFINYERDPAGVRELRTTQVDVLEVSEDGKSLLARHDGHHFMYDKCEDGAWAGGRLNKTYRASKAWYDRIIEAKKYVASIQPDAHLERSDPKGRL